MDDDGDKKEVTYTDSDSLVFSMIAENIFRIFLLAGTTTRARLSLDNLQIMRNELKYFENRIGKLKKIKANLYLEC